MSKVVRVSTRTEPEVFTTFMTFSDDKTYKIEFYKHDTPLSVANALQALSEKMKKENK